jgi:pentatricopeptide repeat protein
MANQPKGRRHDNFSKIPQFPSTKMDFHTNFIKKSASANQLQTQKPKMAPRIEKLGKDPVNSRFLQPLDHIPSRKQVLDKEYMAMSVEGLLDAVISGDPGVAWTIFKHLRNTDPKLLASIHPTIYTRLIQLCCFHVAPFLGSRQAIQVWNFMESHGILADVRDYRAMMYVLVRSKRDLEFERIWTVMINQLKPGLIEYKLKLAMHAQSHEFVKSLSTLQTMLGVSSIGSNQRHLDVPRLELALDPVQLDAEVFALLIDSYQNNPKMVHPLILDMIEVFGIRPDRRVLEALMKQAASQDIPWDSMLKHHSELLEKIESIKNPPSHSLVAQWFAKHVAKALEPVKQESGNDEFDSVKTATNVMDWFTKLYGITPGVETLSCVIRHCRSENDLPKAFEWLAKMRRSFPASIPPMDAFYNVIVLLIRNDKDMKRARELYNVMRLTGMDPNQSIMKQMILGYFASGDFDGVREMVDEMEELGIRSQDDQVVRAIRFAQT